MRLRLSQRAQNDVADIAAYLMNHSPRAADHVQQHMTAALQLIATHPSAGLAIVGGRRRFSLRRFPYVIFYRVDQTVGFVTVLTIRHGARRPEAT